MDFGYIAFIISLFVLITTCIFYFFLYKFIQDVNEIQSEMLRLFLNQSEIIADFLNEAVGADDNK